MSARVLRLPGLSAYADVHALQEQIVAARARGEVPDTLIVVEHAPTITVGRKRDAVANVLLPGDWPVIEVERGGDVTLHLPGQLVIYPIVQLEGARRDLRAHLRALEDGVIAACATWGLGAVRDERNSGVWLDGADGARRKVCSVGVACRQWVTWHGLALNVDADLDAFSRIRPCGFEAGIMTRLADHMGPPPTVSSVEGEVVRCVADALGLGPLERG